MTDVDVDADVDTVDAVDVVGRKKVKRSVALAYEPIDLNAYSFDSFCDRCSHQFRLLP